MLQTIKNLLPISVKDMLKRIFFVKIFKKLGISDKDLWIIEHATFKDDGLINAHNSDFLSDPLFLEAYELSRLAANQSYDLHWRVYIACWSALRGKSLEGDFVECGVNKGMLSRAAMHYIDFKSMPGRKFYLMDTFCGFPDRYKHLSAGKQYEDCYRAAKETFKEFENAILIRGVIPDTLTQVKSNQICYLSIDMNCAEPEIASIEYFWDRLVKGAAVVLDDYAYSKRYERQTNAMDKFAESKGIKVLALPTGQGLIFKP